MSMLKKLKIYVAMSGGVDSSVAAALLSSRGESAFGGKKQGYDVTGVFFKPWLSEDGRAFCNWQEDKRDAARVAVKLGIKFKVWDFSKEYGDKVTKYMINSYRHGITPNPDVMCNKEIKFGLFLKKALAERADYIATGHYARIKKSGEIFKLLKGKDPNKDQSYFLWTLTQKQLRYCLFPVGDYTKPEVRKLAKKFGLHTYAKKDSQGVCFVGQLDVKEFLKEYIKPKEGEIKLLETGSPPHSSPHSCTSGGDSCMSVGARTIGRHDGVYYYTIGQRHGLDIKTGGGPYFVVGKDLKKNIIYVTTDEKNLASSVAKIGKINWIGRKPILPARVGVKIRYRSKSILAEISRDAKSNALIIKFKKPARAVTPGQSAVFYKGEEVVGGGVIA